MKLGRRDSVARRAPTSQQGSWVGNPVATKPAWHGLAVCAGSNGSAAAAQRCLSTTTAALGERSQPSKSIVATRSHDEQRLKRRVKRRSHENGLGYDKGSGAARHGRARRLERQQGA
jgi:hypothetical protein